MHKKVQRYKIIRKTYRLNSIKKRQKLEEVINSLKEKSDDQKRKSPQRYERIVTIEPAGNIDVFDFEVPKNHNLHSQRYCMS